MGRLRDALARWWRPAAKSPAPRTPTPRTPAPGAPATGYPGDFTGIPDLRWAPRHDGRPDPGEVVWTWVPFEEDHTQGKDRPVL
ncbi:MAG TPA: type II toxin-antitoxin system PemK/MazF family toxin, partial [Dermatophilaceae bacterium]|nr:type II toxin-antitoxin system PemK/MazF family toxin [Dermatophilaceae bacterium]